MPDSLNYVNVGPHGTFAPSGNLHTTPADIDHIFDHIDHAGTTKLTVYFHGGLVSEGAGATIAASIATLLEGEAHAVTFIWETGFVETLKKKLGDIASTTVFRKVIVYVIRRVGKLIGGGVGDRGPGEEMEMGEIQAELARLDAFDRFDEGARGGAEALTEDDLAELEAEIQSDIEIDLDADDEFLDAIETDPIATGLMNTEFNDELDADGARGILSTLAFARHMTLIVIRVVRRFMNKRDHGVYPTIVEETLREFYVADFAAWLWGDMKDTAVTMWEPNDDPPTDDSHPGTYLLDKLAAHQAAHPGFVVDLIGHSAGAIAICHMLRTAEQRHPGLRIRNVLLMAPACTSTLFHNEVATRIARFEGFRMYTMEDELEKADRLVPKVYTRSLLYFISGVLESTPDEPLAGLELHSRGASPYDTAELRAVSDFVRADALHRLVLSISTGEDPGLNSAAEDHGAFDNDTETRDSLKAVVAS